MEAQTTATRHAWDEAMARGKEFARHAQWENALQVYNSALNMCAESKLLGKDDSREHRVLKDLAYVNRCMGRYQQAQKLLDELHSKLPPSDPLRLNITGELGVIHRQVNQLEAARDAFQEQYTLATRLDERQRMCRAVGNLGMINYQLSQRDHNHELLDTAVKQLEERVVLAQALKDLNSADPTEAGKYDYAGTLKAIGLSRLSLCYSALGQDERAIATALEALKLARPLTDSSIEAISRFFYGRALYRAGRHQQALEQFDLPKKCSPAVAFCKEPSAEHCDYLRELLAAGAEMDTPDEHGYHALDYAVFNGDQLAESVILHFLKNKVSQSVDAKDASSQVSKRLEEARLRKHYREIFQEQMRPILLAAKDDSLHRIRETYALAIKGNSNVRAFFDPLKYVRYTDFFSFGRFPRSSDGLTQPFDVATKNAAAQHIIFISYRWVNRDPWARYPDDAENRQYRRILKAIEAYLHLHPSISASHLGIWIDFACIDQDAPMPGISALPFVIAQCNALISLVDEQYHQRAWCSVEVMMVQALRDAYGVHLWYEHLEEDGRMVLRVGSEELEARPGGKKLGFEKDRERVRFLVRQCRLLC